MALPFPYEVVIAGGGSAALDGGPVPLLGDQPLDTAILDTLHGYTHLSGSAVAANISNPALGGTVRIEVGPDRSSQLPEHDGVAVPGAGAGAGGGTQGGTEAEGDSAADDKARGTGAGTAGTAAAAAAAAAAGHHKSPGEGTDKAGRVDADETPAPGQDASSSAANVEDGPAAGDPAATDRAADGASRARGTRGAAVGTGPLGAAPPAQASSTEEPPRPERRRISVPSLTLPSAPRMPKPRAQPVGDGGGRPGSGSDQEFEAAGMMRKPWVVAAAAVAIAALVTSLLTLSDTGGDEERTSAEQDTVKEKPEPTKSGDAPVNTVRPSQSSCPTQSDESRISISQAQVKARSDARNRAAALAKSESKARAKKADAAKAKKAAEEEARKKAEAKRKNAIPKGPVTIFNVKTAKGAWTSPARGSGTIPSTRRPATPRRTTTSAGCWTVKRRAAGRAARTSA